jgi:hypothetical protein
MLTGCLGSRTCRPQRICQALLVNTVSQNSAVLTQGEALSSCVLAVSRIHREQVIVWGHGLMMYFLHSSTYIAHPSTYYTQKTPRLNLAETHEDGVQEAFCFTVTLIKR